jgi:group I intron endonuclease
VYSQQLGKQSQVYKIMVIYKISNTINSKIYIGQTIKKLSERIYGHFADAKRNRNTKIARAIRKYGIDNFNFEIIDNALSQEELNELEKKYIKLFNSNTNEFGYNLLSGGNQGGKHSDETKLKISKKLKENPNKYWLGKSHSIESNQKRKETMKGVSCPKRGRKFSEEEKKIKSEKMKKIRSEKFWSTKKIQ